MDFHEQKPENKGFTLIEVVVAMLILSIGVLGIFKMQISAIQGNANGRKLTEANIAAQSQIESLMQQNFTTLASTTASLTHNDDDTIPVGYTLTYTVVNDPDGNGIDDLRQVTVYLNDSTGKQRVDLTFMRAIDL